MNCLSAADNHSSKRRNPRADITSSYDRGKIPTVAPYSVLHQPRFTEPLWLPITLVGSYPTVSPLSSSAPAVGRVLWGTVCFLWHFLWVTPSYLRQPACSMVSRLSSILIRPEGALKTAIARQSFVPGEYSSFSRHNSRCVVRSVCHCTARARRVCLTPYVTQSALFCYFEISYTLDGK